MASGAPSSLAILVDEKRVNELLAQKTGAKAVLRSACNVFLFILFLVLYSALALSAPLMDKRAFEGQLRRTFDLNATVSIGNVTSIDSFWMYMRDTLFTGIYGTNWPQYYLPGQTVPTMLSMGSNNYLFGVGRLRMVKIKPNLDCGIPLRLKASFSTCYGDYSYSDEDKVAFGPVTNTGQPAFTYMKDPNGINYNGQLATYGTGGFMKAFSSNFVQSFAGMETLVNDGFMTIAVRAIFIDFTVYSFNLGLYAVVSIAFEISPTAAWVNTMDITILEQRDMSALGSGTATEWLYLVGQIFLVLFVLRYLLEEASEFLGTPQPANEVIGCGGRFKIPVIRLEYFFDAWNLLDLSNLALIIVALYYRVQAWSKAANLQVYIGDPAGASLATFTNFSSVAQPVGFAASITAFNMVLIWFKAVKYINIIPYITTFMQTVSMAQRNIVSFVFQFATTIIGFVLAFNVAFGEELSEFRTPYLAAVFLMRTFLGNGDMSEVYNYSPILGSLLILLFVAVIVFVMMNLFKGIIITALADAKMLEDANSAKKWAQTLDRFHDLWKQAKVSFQLERRFRMTVPGLYSRVMARQRQTVDLEKLRDQAVMDRTYGSMPDDALALGPGAPSWGRRQKRNLATAAIEDAPADSDSEGSEVDLGPLRSQDQLKRTGGAAAAATTFSGTKSGGFGTTGFMGGTGMGNNAAADGGDATAETVGLVIDATRHVASGIITRTRGAKCVLFGEMTESKEVLNSIGVVLEVLARRARDLEAQQRQVMKTLDF